jgi:hypothetical protein
MILPTHYTTSLDDINKALTLLPSQEPGKQTINQPTGDFFYDPWEIKPEYKGTVWEQLLNDMGEIKGEARVITLTSKSNYVSHCDIDDRFHLNLSGVFCYLIDLDNNKMYPTVKDGIWYSMDTSKLHTAANFGNTHRHQLVVRQLLKHSNIKDPVNVRIVPTIDNVETARFLFDHTISSLLNTANKHGVIDNFKLTDSGPTFTCERVFINVLTSAISNKLELIII